MLAHNLEESPTVAQGSAIKKKIFLSGELIFEDNFDTVDFKKWSFDGNIQAHINEFQLYTSSKENTYTKDEVLNIKPTFYNKTKGTEDMKLYGRLYSQTFHPIRSARISTKESFTFMYGILEVKAKVPTGDWLFPAIWLMPRDAHYGDWPLSGEMDLMESRGNQNLTDFTGNFVGNQQIGSTLHWGPNKILDQWKLTHCTKTDSTSFSSEFYVYKLVWTPNNISFYVNDVEIGVVTPPDGGFWELGKFDKALYGRPTVLTLTSGDAGISDEQEIFQHWRTYSIVGSVGLLCLNV